MRRASPSSRGITGSTFIFASGRRACVAHLWYCRLGFIRLGSLVWWVKGTLGTTFGVCHAGRAVPPYSPTRSLSL